ncbi:5-oxoprolinase subunit PxpB [Mucilaginibacter mali]|uniref:5-oxoprolinase subunit PxpB n=1 Tax=Mucilaginibacter mali TaxID=2740462 RepID=A0A7D4Q1T4_9SPHI|nr:5-oxoprolinase subunit PxpB [Mucilaginibacter mali]QKJ29187.1 5-oxoprolinase subunit PxpB [Mucilaginibacter mali]
MIKTSAYTGYQLNEQAVTLNFGNEISEELLALITRAGHLLNAKPFPGFRSIVPAYTTLSVFFDPIALLNSILPGHDCLTKISMYLENQLKQPADSSENKGRDMIIPVLYGSEYGPDLEELAQRHGLRPEAVTAMHTEVCYTVYMIGFTPGFAYLGGLDERLFSPRKDTPRSKVPAGSVGIAGMQTGIYPFATPGGWQIIGRTPLKMFDPEREQPALLQAGDKVSFKAIDEETFYRLLST